MNDDRQTLAQFFESVYLPSKLADTTANMHYQYRTAIGLFCEFMERNAFVDEVSELHINAFEHWCWRTGREVNAGKYRRLIAAVMRLARPGEFQPKPAGPPHRPNPDLQPGTLWHFLKTVYQPQRLGAAPASTIESFERSVRLLYRFKESVVLLSDLTDDLVSRAMQDLLSKGRALSTCNNFRRHLLAIWRFAKRRGAVTTMPDVQRFREPRPIPAAWSLDDVATILDAASRHPGSIALPGTNGVILLGPFFVALLRTLYETGARITALLSLRRTAVDLESCFLRVDARYQKHRADGLYKVSSTTIDALSSIWTPERELMFPWPYDRKGRQWPTLNRHLRAILRGAGFTPGPKDGFHKFRRTLATVITEKMGIEEARKQLGHSSIAVTKGYVDPSKLSIVHPIDVLPPLPAPKRKGGAA